MGKVCLKNDLCYVATKAATIANERFPFGTVVCVVYDSGGKIAFIHCAKFPRYRGKKPISVNRWTYDVLCGEWSISLKTYNNGKRSRMWEYWQRIDCAPKLAESEKWSCGNTASFMRDAITRKKSSGGVVDAKHVHDVTDYSCSKTVPFKDFTGSIPVLSGNYSETHSAYSRC